MINSTGTNLTAQKNHYFGRACVNAEDQKNLDVEKQALKPILRRQIKDVMNAIKMLGYQAKFDRSGYMRS